MAITLLVFEGLLRATDPWGMYYFDDISYLQSQMQATDWGAYVYPSGQYQLTHRDFYINSDHSRRVPDTNPNSNCQIVAIGDSVTFGHDVEDEQTWVNLVAKEFPQVRFINAGMTGYNSHHILRSMEQFPDADGFIYLIVENDAEPYQAFKSFPKHQKPLLYSLTYDYLHAYYKVEKINDTPTEREIDRFLEDVGAILQHSNTVVFGYDKDLASLVYSEYPEVVLIDQYTDYISRMDGHPNVKGHQFIAEQLKPHLKTLIRQACLV